MEAGAGRTHHHRPGARTDRGTHPQGRHRRRLRRRARLPRRSPGHPGHPPDQADHPKPGKKNSWRTEVVYAVVTLPAEQATAAELADWIRSHWFIENRLHWVRDVTLGEGLHQARTHNGLHVLAILRNVVISVLRLAGHTNIARALRHYGRHTDQVIQILTRTFMTSQ